MLQGWRVALPKPVAAHLVRVNESSATWAFRQSWLYGSRWIIYPWLEFYPFCYSQPVLVFHFQSPCLLFSGLYFLFQFFTCVLIVLTSVVLSLSSFCGRSCPVVTYFICSQLLYPFVSIVDFFANGNQQFIVFFYYLKGLDSFFEQAHCPIQQLALVSWLFPFISNLKFINCRTLVSFTSNFLCHERSETLNATFPAYTQVIERQKIKFREQKWFGVKFICS